MKRTQSWHQNEQMRNKPFWHGEGFSESFRHIECRGGRDLLYDDEDGVLYTDSSSDWLLINLDIQHLLPSHTTDEVLASLADAYYRRPDTFQPILRRECDAVLLGRSRASS